MKKIKNTICAMCLEKPKKLFVSGVDSSFFLCRPCWKVEKNDLKINKSVAIEERTNIMRPRKQKIND